MGNITDMASKELERTVAAQKRRNCYRAASEQFDGLVAEATTSGLTVKYDVPSEEDFLAGMSGLAFRILHDFQRNFEIGRLGFTSAPYQDSWSTGNIVEKLRVCFESQGVLEDEVYILLDCTDEWLELTAETLLVVLPLVEETDWFWRGGDRAVIERQGRWCCYLNRHGSLGFGFRNQ